MPGYPVRGGLYDGLKGLAGAGLGRAEPGFEFAEGGFDKVKIGE